MMQNKLSSFVPSCQKWPIVIYLFKIDSFSFADLEQVGRLRSQGKRVICIWEDVWIRKNELIRKKLTGDILGRKSIFARNCTIKTLNKKDADLFFDATHILGTARAIHRYGLFNNGQLVAAAAFSRMRRIVRNGEVFCSYEWVRYASLPGIRVAGGMGKLLSAFVTEHHPDDVMSYADKEWSEGAAYRKLGFTLTGETSIQNYWLDPDTMQRFPQKRHPDPQPHWKRVYGLGSLKYVKLFT